MPDTSANTSTTPEDRKRSVRRFYEVLWDAQDHGAIPTLLHEDFTLVGGLISDLWVLGDLKGLEARLAGAAETDGP